MLLLVIVMNLILLSLSLKLLCNVIHIYKYIMYLS